MKRLPDAELTLMMAIWEGESPVSRTEIEKRLDSDKEVVPSTILTLLSRLEERGFVHREKKGKINYYTPLVKKDLYLKETGKNILQKMFGGSLTNFAATLFMDEELSQEDIAQLQKFIDSKSKEAEK